MRPVLAILSNTINLLSEIDRDMSRENTPSLTWQFDKLSMGSPVTAVMYGMAKQGRPNVNPAETMVRGLSQIDSEIQTPQHFTMKALDLARTLAKGDSAIQTTFQSNGSSYRPSIYLSARVEQLLGHVDSYSVEMSVDGRLDAIYVHGDKPEFFVFDPVSDRGIKCLFPEEDIDRVLSLLQSRVRVYGDVRFNKRDEIVSVQVGDFERLPELKEVPSLGDLHSAGIDITGGEDAADYVNRMRDAE